MSRSLFPRLVLKLRHCLASHRVFVQHPSVPVRVLNVSRLFSSGSRLDMGVQQVITLPTGAKMPALGFGTWQAGKEELENAVELALEAGYRLIDTAHAYETEEAVGNVVNRWIDAGKLKREDLFIISKLPPGGNYPAGVEKYLKRSLASLRLDYLDIYLVHTPFGFKDVEGDLHPKDKDGNILMDITTDHVAVWKAMEAQVDAGRAKAIGLSNFNVKQIQRILDTCRIKPANLQVELHVYCQQKELLAFCQQHKITMTAYSPLGSRGTAKIFERTGISKELPDPLSAPQVLEIAKRHNKSPAQVLLLFTIQRGVSVIPKSTNAKRIKENFEVYDFELSAAELETLGKLDQGSAGRILDFSFFKGLSKHPEFPF